MTRGWRLVAGSIVFVGAALSIRAAEPLGLDPRGLYLYSFNVAVDKPPSKAADVMQALAQPGIDGLTLVENWSALEPARGVYSWDLAPPGQSQFDQWLQATITAGKKINLAIRAGQDTPCWLFETMSQSCGQAYSGGYSGARQWTFQAAAHQGLANATCETVSLAAPWDLAFLSEWASMLDAVSSHLRRIGAYDAISLVRVTGINRTTDEFRLPEELLPSPCIDADGAVHPATNAISTWLAAGYRPGLLLMAWNSITDAFLRSFPDKTFNVPIIPIDTGHRQFPFPEIDERGCVYTSIVPASTWTVPDAIPPGTCTDEVDAATADKRLNSVLFDLLLMAGIKFPGQLAVEFENLTYGDPASAAVVQFANELRVAPAFMTNNFKAAQQPGVGAACGGGFSGPQDCTPAQYLTLLETGINPCQNAPADPYCHGLDDLRSMFLEVFAPDVEQFSGKIALAHAELFAPRPNGRRPPRP
jgi:hypothetical protein